MNNSNQANPRGREIAAAPAERARARTRLGISDQLSHYRLDILWAAGAGAIATLYALWGFSQLNFDHLASVYDTWFDADVQRIVGGYYNRGLGWHVRTNVHPLYALLVASPCIILRKIGLDAWTVAATLVSFSAFAFSAAFYAAARVLSLKRLDALMVTLLMLSTSASLFWLPIPETYALGATTMLLAMVWLGAPRGGHDRLTGPLQSAVTLSITITNWMAGLLAALLALGVRRAIVVSAIALTAVFALNLTQKLIFPNAGTFFDLGYERRFMGPTEREPFGARLVSFVGQPLLAPEPRLNTGTRTVGIVMSSPIPTVATATTWLAVAGWSLLLILGTAAVLRGGAPPPLVLFLGGVFAGQVVLHMLYGDQLFLYTLHFAPFMVLVAALACASRWRKAVLALVAVTALASFAHNLVEFRAAAELLPKTSTDQEFIHNYIR